MAPMREAALVLADGSVFEGELIGADPVGGVAGGEVVLDLDFEFRKFDCRRR